jgi:hypothetical protein
VNVAEALRKRPQPPSWTQREFTSALIALVKMDQPKARRHAKMNVIQTLAEAAPREFTGGAYHDSVAYREHRNARVVAIRDSGWPGPHKNVRRWYVLDNGKAVGWNENPTRAWSFHVIRFPTGS